MLTHSLFSQNLDITIAFFEKYCAEDIIEEIKNHLKQHPTDTLEHCKEYSKENIKKYYGSEILSFYQNNKDNKPCKVILKGSKEYLKPLK